MVLFKKKKKTNRDVWSGNWNAVVHRHYVIQWKYMLCRHWKRQSQSGVKFIQMIVVLAMSQLLLCLYLLITSCCLVWYSGDTEKSKWWCHQFGRICPNRKFVAPLGLEKMVTKSIRNGSVGGAQRAKETPCDAEFCEVFFRMHRVD